MRLIYITHLVKHWQSRINHTINSKMLWVGLKAKLVFIGLLATLCLPAQAQYVPDYGQQQATASSQQQPSFQDRLIPFGNFSFNLSNNYTFIDVSPGLLYAFTPKLHAGLGVNYLYRSFEYNTNSGPIFKLTSSNYGGRAVARYTIFQNFFAATEYMILNVEAPITFAGSETERVWFHNPSVGGGAFLPLGGRAAASISVMYMLNNDQRLNPYRSMFGLGNFHIQLGISI